MADYKITRISQDPPREWDGPNGKVYYIKCMLEGHPKAVSIGKKSPDALTVGMTVSGTINPDPSHDEDKFKAEAKPFIAGGFSSGSSSKPAYQPKDEHAIAKAVALKAAVEHINGAADPSDVLKTADQFLAWLEGKDETPASIEPRVDYDPDFGPPPTPQQDDIDLSSIIPF